MKSIACLSICRLYAKNLKLKTINLINIFAINTQNRKGFQIKVGHNIDIFSFSFKTKGFYSCKIYIYFFIPMIILAYLTLI